MKRKSKRIFILTPLTLLVYFSLVSIVMTYNMRYAILIVTLGFISLVGLFNHKIEKMFLNKYNRFAYFSVFFLLVYLSAWSRFHRLKEEALMGREVSTFTLAWDNLEVTTSSFLFCIFLIAYGGSRLRSYLDERKYIKQELKRIQEKKETNNHAPSLP